MNQTISITPKWQIHIPVEARKKINLTKPTQMNMTVKDGSLILTPKKSKLLSLSASITPPKNVKQINLDTIRDHIDYGDL